MLVERTSIVSGIRREKEIGITADQLMRVTTGGEHIQNVAPRLSVDDREFIISGITAEEWDEIMGPEE